MKAKKLFGRAAVGAVALLLLLGVAASASAQSCECSLLIPDKVVWRVRLNQAYNALHVAGRMAVSHLVWCGEQVGGKKNDTCLGTLQARPVGAAFFAMKDGEPVEELFHGLHQILVDADDCVVAARCESSAARRSVFSYVAFLDEPTVDYDSIQGSTLLEFDTVCDGVVTPGVATPALVFDTSFKTMVNVADSDLDGDGAQGWQEDLWGTTDADWDTDGDTFNDSVDGAPLDPNAH